VVDAAHHVGGGAVSTLLAAVWLATVLAGFWAHRPAPSRVQLLVPAVARPPSRSMSPVARRVGGAVGAAVVAWLVFAPVAPFAGVGAWAWPVWRARRGRRADRLVVARAVPEVVDLLSVAVGAGLTVPQAVVAVGARVGGPFGDAFGGVAQALATGIRCSDALDDAARALGDEARPLLDVLRSSARYGASLTEPLARLSAEARADRRRRAEEVARRVPVQLLFPLVTCVLPAFALLTVAPMLAGTLGSLRLSFH
jgi:tight adherence protein C